MLLKDGTILHRFIRSTTGDNLQYGSIITLTTVQDSTQGLYVDDQDEDDNYGNGNDDDDDWEDDNEIAVTDPI